MRWLLVVPRPLGILPAVAAHLKGTGWNLDDPTEWIGRQPELGKHFAPTGLNVLPLLVELTYRLSLLNGKQ